MPRCSPASAAMSAAATLVLPAAGGVSSCRNRPVCARRTDDGPCRVARARTACRGHRMARARRRLGRRADFRRSGFCRGAARHRRPARADSARSGGCTARRQGRGRGGRARRDRNRHFGATRPDGAALRLSTGHRALRPAAFRDWPGRFRRQRLPLLGRSAEPNPFRHRPAVRHRQCRRVSFPALRALATIGRIDAGAALAALPDPVTGQRLVGTAADLGAMAGGAPRAWRQSAGHGGLRRARRAGFARGGCRRISVASDDFPPSLTRH